MSKITLFSLIIFCCSCASLKTEQEQLSQSYKEYNYKESKSILNSKDFKRKQNTLLRFMELATVSYREKKLFEALDLLRDAQIIADKLYTKSIKKLILSGFVGDEVKDFYGKIYERSALYQMQVIIFFKLYSGETFLKKENVNEVETYVDFEVAIAKRKSYLLKARSSVLDWNTFYDELKRTSPDNYFSYDYYQQILSALVHEEIGTRKELNIALILYENTLMNFNKLVALYPSFNLHYESSLESYLDRKEKKMVTLTPSGERLKDFVIFKILNLTKKIRKNKYKRKLKKLNPSKHVLAKLEKDSENITLIYSSGLIDSMKEKIVSYNLNWMLNKIEDDNVRALVEVIGISTLTYFTLGTLGLPLYTHAEITKSGRYIYSRNHSANSLIKNIGIDIKVPYQSDDFTIDHIKLVSEQRGIGEFSVFGSNAERSFVSTKQFANKYYDSLGPKIAIKYIAAIVGAYSSYKALKDAENPFASTLALAQYLVTTKAIAATQSVDLRNWVGLSRSGQFLNISKSEVNQKELSLEFLDGSKALLDRITTKSLFFL